MKIQKRSMLIIVLAVLILLLASAGAVATLHLLIPLKTATDAQTSIAVDADTLKSQAYAALNRRDLIQAKKIFEHAKVEYEKDNNINAIAEIDGQLYLINNAQPSIPTPAPVTVNTR